MSPKIANKIVDGILERLVSLECGIEYLIRLTERLEARTKPRLKKPGTSTVLVMKKKKVKRKK